jgi:arylsulfatase A-like enzyme
MKVLVLVAHGLQPAYLGGYGNEWIATPALDQFAAAGAVFDQHFADVPSEVGAARAWRTGRYAFPELVRDSDVDLIQQLSRSGVRTHLITASDAKPYGSGWRTIRAVEPQMEAALEAASGAFDDLAEQDKWLLWLDFGTLAPPWDLPEEFLERYFQTKVRDDEDDASDEGGDEEKTLECLPAPRSGCLNSRDDTSFLRIQGTYAGAVTLFDTATEALFEELRERGLEEELLVIVTSDRGLALGEHGFVGDGRAWLHEEVTHLPLLVRWPGQIEPGLRIDALTQSIDLMPTLLDAFGQSVSVVHGRSLLPLLRKETEQIRPYVCSSMTVGDSAELALRTPKWSFLLPLRTPQGDPPRAVQLYARPEDRGEVNNVAQHNLDFTEALECTLRRFAEATRQPGSLQAPELPAERPDANPVTQGSTT